ncbi:MAG: hypothetical protein U0165_19535 [Polyangiaceae bacterium]
MKKALRHWTTKAPIIAGSSTKLPAASNAFVTAGAYARRLRLL